MIVIMQVYPIRQREVRKKQLDGASNLCFILLYYNNNDSNYDTYGYNDWRDGRCNNCNISWNLNHIDN